MKAVGHARNAAATCLLFSLLSVAGCATRPGTVTMLDLGKGMRLELGNGVTMDLVRVPAGTFTMGSATGEMKLVGYEDVTRPVQIPVLETMVGPGGGKRIYAGSEGPRRQVTITRPFYMGVTEVTRGQFAAFVADTGYKTAAEKEGWAEAYDEERRTWERVKGASWRKVGFEQTDAHPVVCVNWHDAMAFCTWLRLRTGMRFSLPTEAQWEYACRAGATTRFGFGDRNEDLHKHGNYYEKSCTVESWYDKDTKHDDGHAFTAPVKSYPPNPWGLYDMHGNVKEWCSDWHAETYADAYARDPQGPDFGDRRIARGGSWFNESEDCRAADRWNWHPSHRQYNYGFRVAVTLGGDAGPTRPQPVPALSAAEARRHQVAAAKALNVETQSALNFGEGVTMKLSLVPAGKFTRGSAVTEKGRWRGEGPQLPVTITRPFYMGTYEVTQGQYQAIMAANPSQTKGATRPVGEVSWAGAVEFCKRLSAKTGKTVRLPTEAEWEYACRAGTTTRFSFGDRDEDLEKNANYCDPSCTHEHAFSPRKERGRSDGHDRSAPVGSFRPNAWGLYDMHGNVSEWCSDWHADTYANAGTRDPRGSLSGIHRVIRGGSWITGPRSCRAACRSQGYPRWGFVAVGFRVVVEIGSGTD